MLERIKKKYFLESKEKKGAKGSKGCRAQAAYLPKRIIAFSTQDMTMEATAGVSLKRLYRYIPRNKNVGSYGSSIFSYLRNFH